MLFEDVIPASVPESPFALLDEAFAPPSGVQDDDVGKELLELSESVTLESSDDRVHEELEDSSTEALLPSSPQATRKKNAIA